MMLNQLGYEVMKEENGKREIMGYISNLIKFLDNLEIEWVTDGKKRYIE